MLTTMSTATKKKRVSKKLKVSWRKHVQINDVEEYLEEIRLEERLGPSLSTVEDNELFKLDTRSVSETLSSKEKRKLRAQRPVTCFPALQPHSKVPDPISKRNRVRTKEERKSGIIKEKEIQNSLKGILKAKQIQSLKDKKLYEIKRASKPKKGDICIDIWAEDLKPGINLSEWAETNTKKHNLRGVGVPLKNIPKTALQKNSPLPAIEIPHPGMSYNPSFEDHQNLLKTVADEETNFIKKEEYLTRVTRGMFNKVSPATRDSSWLVEMSEGLPTKEEPNLDENEGDEYKAVNPPVKNLKKTVKQRRKQKEQQELELKRKATKLEKKKISDIHQLKLLKKQIEKSDKKQKILKEKRKKRAAYKALEPKRISSTKYEAPGLDFNLVNDLSGNLKNVKKEGSILVDCFKNLQKRNILEPSIKRVRKNAKVKRYIKPSYKEDWKKTVAR